MSVSSLKATKATPPTAEDVHAATCPAAIHKPAPPAPPFRFLDLPGEIQNHVVNYFIVSSHALTIHKPQFNRHPSPPPKARERPRFDRPVPPTPPLSRSVSADSAKANEEAQLGHTRLALMLTCRKLYREHWRTYYGENMFEFSTDTFDAFMDQIPVRCQAQIRRVRFRMPHKHHHGRIWTMLAGLRRLEELHMVFCPPSLTEDTEYDQAVEGAKHCARLLTFGLTRAEEDDETQCENAERIRQKDLDVEERINKFLRDREKDAHKKRSRSRSRPARTSRDGAFPENISEA